jgi:hypothetical protein
LLLSTACGDGANGDAPDDRSPAEVLAAAGSATLEERTVRASTEQLTSVQGQEVTTLIEGVADLVTGDSESTVDLSLPGQDPMTSQVIIEDATVYVEASSIPGAPTDARWISIDSEALGSQLRINLEAFHQNGAALLATLAEGVDVKEVDTESVRETETTQYRFTTDLAALAESGPEELRSSFEQVIQLTGSEEISTQVWIDDEDRVRRIVTTLEFEVANQQISQETTVEYFEFGVEVDVQPPQEQDTVDITELTGGGAP